MDWVREPQLLESLDIAVPDILASQNDKGQFGTEPWISTDQNVLLALAVRGHWKTVLIIKANRCSMQLCGAVMR